jgi:hypothetical protein
MATQGASRVTINSGGSFEVIGGGSLGYNLPFVNNGGRFWIRNTGTAALSGGNQTTRSYSQISGDTFIQNGSTLQVTNAASIAGGRLVTLVNANLPLTYAAQQAQITGTLFVSGANTELRINDNTVDVYGFHHYGRLNVTGNMEWRGGTFFPRISAVQAGPTDSIAVGGILTIFETARVAPIVRGGPLAANQLWDIMTADTVIGLPSVDQPYGVSRDPMNKKLRLNS